MFMASERPTEWKMEEFRFDLILLEATLSLLRVSPFLLFLEVFVVIGPERGRR